MNAILDSLSRELEEDYHQELLEKGNLGPRKRENPWTGEHNWTGQGYLARLTHHHCAHCGSIKSLLEGVYLVETNGLGNRRLTALNLYRANLPGEGLPCEAQTVNLPRCLDCLPLL